MQKHAGKQHKTGKDISERPFQKEPHDCVSRSVRIFKFLYIGHS